MWDAIHEAKRLAQRALGLAQSSIVWSRLTNSSADGQSDGAGGWPSDASSGEPDNQLRLRRAESWGVRGRPIIDNVYGLICRAMGGPAANVLVGIATPKYGRQDLQPGETQLYNKIAGCEVWLDTNGTVHVNAPSGQKVSVAADTVELAGNTYSLPQWDLFMTAFGTFLTTTAGAASVAVIAGAATTFKTAITTASDFKSTKVKNG